MLTKVHRIGVAALVVLVLGLAGCAATHPVAIGIASPSSSPSSPSSLSLTPSPTPTPAAAVQAFGGSCDSVLGTAAVSSALGVTEVPRMVIPDEPYTLATVDYGGTPCHWSQNTTGDNGAFLNAVVLSAASGVPVATNDISCYGSTAKSATSQGACSFSNSAAGYWITGVLYTAVGTTNSAAKAAVQNLTAVFAANSASAAASGASAPAAPAGVWSHTANCDGISTTSKVATALASPGLKVQDSDTEPGEMPGGYAASLRAAGVYACAWGQTASSVPAGQIAEFTATVLPGGGSLSTVVAALPGASRVQVTGAAHSYVLSDAQLSTDLDVFAGSNMLQLNFDKSATVARMSSAASSLIAALDAGESN
jgi:hypothetical protein